MFMFLFVFVFVFVFVFSDNGSHRVTYISVSNVKPLSKDYIKQQTATVAKYNFRQTQECRVRECVDYIPHVKPTKRTVLISTFCWFTGENVVTAVAQWLRRCATNRKVAGSIPTGVTGIFL